MIIGICVVLKQSGVLEFQIERDSVPTPGDVIDEITENNHIETEDGGYVNFDKNEASGIKIVPMEPIRITKAQHTPPTEIDLASAERKEQKFRDQLGQTLITKCGNCGKEALVQSERQEPKEFTGNCPGCGSALSVFND